MKPLFLILFSLFTTTIFAQQKPKANTFDKNKEVMIVDASCGQCKFGLKAKGCDLAVRIDGKAYFVDGTAIDEHGDAHAQDGFCNAIRKVKVQGEVKDGRFKATYFELLSEPVKN
jgi:hypothetical protein